MRVALPRQLNDLEEITMRRWLCATTGFLILLTAATNAAHAAGPAGPLKGTWKGTLHFLNQDAPINVQLQINQRGIDSFTGVGIGCDPSPIPGCPPGTANGSATFHGEMLNPTTFALQFDAPETGKCVTFIAGDGALRSDGNGNALRILASGQDGGCNPVLWIINAARP
jgi:hypothetical protein